MDIHIQWFPFFVLSTFLDQLVNFYDPIVPKLSQELQPFALLCILLGSFPSWLSNWHNWTLNPLLILSSCLLILCQQSEFLYHQKLYCRAKNLWFHKRSYHFDLRPLWSWRQSFPHSAYQFSQNAFLQWCQSPWSFNFASLIKNKHFPDTPQPKLAKPLTFVF